jgi:hypothetical protein
MEPEIILDAPHPPRILTASTVCSGENIYLPVWAVSEGRRSADTPALFDGPYQRLVAAGVPLWRSVAGMPTLQP